MTNPEPPPPEPASKRLPAGRLKHPSAAARDRCGNGHPWRPETTRWRRRVRNGRVTVERDCLRCKAVSEAGRRSRKAAGPSAGVVGW